MKNPWKNLDVRSIIEDYNTYRSFNEIKFNDLVSKLVTKEMMGEPPDITLNTNFAIVVMFLLSNGAEFEIFRNLRGFKYVLSVVHSKHVLKLCKENGVNMKVAVHTRFMQNEMEKDDLLQLFVMSMIK